MKGLGEKSAIKLSEIGINNAEDLHAYGAVRAFIKLKKESSVSPSLNLLYAMVGAVEDRVWLDVAQNEKGRLLMELEGYLELETLLNAEGLRLNI